MPQGTQDGHARWVKYILRGTSRQGEASAPLRVSPGDAGAQVTTRVLNGEEPSPMPLHPSQLFLHNRSLLPRRETVFCTEKAVVS